MGAEEGSRKEDSSSRSHAVGGKEGEENPEKDRNLITFSVGHTTAATWQQLKQDTSLDNAQLAAFLLQWYADATNPPFCPHCQSVLQRFCSTCSSVIDIVNSIDNNAPAEHNNPNPRTPTSAPSTCSTVIDIVNSIDNNAPAEHNNPNPRPPTSAPRMCSSVIDIDNSIDNNTPAKHNNLNPRTPTSTPRSLPEKRPDQGSVTYSSETAHRTEKSDPTHTSAKTRGTSPSHRNQSERRTSSALRSFPGKRCDQNSTSFPFETAHSTEKPDPTHASVKIGCTVPCPRNESKRSCASVRDESKRSCTSVSTESDCSLEDIVEDQYVNDHPEWTPLDVDDLTDDVGEREENGLGVTEDVEVEEKTEECESSGSSREKVSAAWNLLGSKRESPVNHERSGVRFHNEASVENVNNRMTTETKREIPLNHGAEGSYVKSRNETENVNSRMSTEDGDKIASDLKFETQVTDSKENKGNDASESSKPDIASCTWCEMSFKTIVALTKHLTVHTTQSWQSQHFTLPAWHKTTNPERCVKNRDRTCKTKTNTRSKRSTQSQKRGGIKSECFQDSTGKKTLADSSAKIFRCLQCGEGWKTPVGLTYHIQSTHVRKNMYRCLKCGKTFSSLRGISFHMRTHPASRTRERDPVTHPHQCGQCGARFMHVGNLANHVERHPGPGPLGCAQCRRPFHSLTALTGHRCHTPSQHGQDPGLSQGSPASARSVSDAGEEILADHRSAGVESLPSSEPDDNRSERQEKEEFRDLADFIHKGKAPPAKRGRKRKKTAAALTMKEAKRPWKCSDCPASFLYASVLKVHAQKHSGQKAFACRQCQQSFTSKTRLYAHQERDHWGSMPITCQDCGKVFATARTLDEHGVLHTGERPYPCSTCGEAFPYRTALTRHRRTHRASYFRCGDCGAEFHLKSEYKHHTDEHRAIRPHLCSHCGQAFSSMTLLKQHADKHGQKQFVCELCGKAFRKKGEHKMHLMTHQTVKPFPCPLCERSFVSRSKLQLHNSIAHLRLRPHTCPECDAGFTSVTYLKDHVRFAHTTERPFACSLCLARFAAKRFLKLHLKRTHKNAKRDSVSAEGDFNSSADQVC
ncbi:hypothetical protein ACOMHN_050444 [Nucella lapillus]